MSGGSSVPRVAALVLAAGHSSRMGARNKLLEEVGGQPIVEGVVRRLLELPFDDVVVVTGHDADAVEERIPAPAIAVRNPDHAEGIGASVRVGIGALDGSVDGVLICLGDMPVVSADTLLRLVETFRSDVEPAAAYVPVHAGHRGNPVLWTSAYFSRLLHLGGDSGARGLLAEYSEAVCEVIVDDPGVLTDIDTPQALRAIRSDRRRPSD